MEVFGPLLSLTTPDVGRQTGSIVRVVVRVDGQKPRAAAVAAGEIGDGAEEVDADVCEVVDFGRSGEDGRDGSAGDLVAEGKPGVNASGERPGGGGQEDQKVGQLTRRDGPLVIVQPQVLQQLPVEVGMDDRRREGMLNMTHGDFLVHVVEKQEFRIPRASL